MCSLIAVYFLTLDTPGPSSIFQQQDLAVKGRTVTLECRVLDLGHPQSTLFEWKKEDVVLNETGSQLHLKPVAVSTQGNYSCAAVNEIGPGSPFYYQLSAVGLYKILTSLKLFYLLFGIFISVINYCGTFVLSVPG